MISFMRMRAISETTLCKLGALSCLAGRWFWLAVAVLLVPVAVPAAATELPQGMILHLSFDEWRSDSVPDQSGRGNSGKGSSVKWVSSAKQGGGCEFALTGASIRIPSSASLNPKKTTLALWIKADVVASERYLVEKQGDSGFAFGIDASGKPRFCVGGHICNGDAVVADGGWHHVAATFDGESLKLYADGTAQKQTTAWRGEIATNDAEIVLGMKSCDPKLQDKEPSFGGAMDEVMVFDHALTPSEIQTVMAYIKPKFTKSQVAQRLNELKDLLDRGLILQDFYDRKVKECESGE